MQRPPAARMEATVRGALSGRRWVVGLAASALLSKALAGLLFGVTPTDTTTLIGVTVLVLFICGIASFVPARRVIGFDPVDVLKGD